ncbi:hypothetical protein AB6804_31780, partial [Caballeronia sp. RCC_10]
ASRVRCADLTLALDPPNHPLRIQKRLKKPIIGINLWGATNTSTVVQNGADIMVNWNADSIVQAIRKLA